MNNQAIKDTLWILTEERPKASVIKQIVDQYCTDFNDRIVSEENIKIRPVVKAGKFQFSYSVEGLTVESIEKIEIFTVSGSSSFFDFLVFKQKNKPIPSSSDEPIMAIEETKTSDAESRNTGVYQRASKFIFVDYYYKNVKPYMLYNDELEDDGEQPSNTSVFGTNLLLSLNVKIIGKDISKWFKPFESIDEIIEFKKGMRKPPKGNVPIQIYIHDKILKISGRLSKPADAGNIGHDPNIGALSLISKSVRDLGWAGKIEITDHGISQEYIDKTKGNNKFLYICKILNLSLEDRKLPDSINLPNDYWRYEENSEKIGSILLHLVAEYSGDLLGVYQNHAGCERGYFKTKNNELIALPKVDREGIVLNIPDLILFGKKMSEIIVVEGKQLSTLQNGINEIELYDSLENEFIKLHYNDCKVSRWVCIYGGDLENLPHPKVIMYLNNSGRVFINQNSSETIKKAFQNLGFI